MPLQFIRWTYVVGVFFLVGAGASVAWAQPRDAATGKRSEPYLANWGRATGAGTFRPGRWAQLRFDMANPTKSPVDLLSAVFVAGHPNLQYGRRVWVPAGAHRVTSHPFLVPKAIPQSQSRLELKSVFLDDSGREMLRRSDEGEILDTAMQALDHALGSSTTGYIQAGTPSDDLDLTYEMLVALRFAKDHPRRVSQLNDNFLPASPQDYDTLDQLALASDQVQHDAAGLAALRNWVQGGGTLWLPLDRLQKSTVEAVLQDAFACEIIDSVDLTDVEVRAALPGGESSPREEFEIPVPLVRVIPHDVQVTHTANGWPAAFWQPYGRGMVIYTALGPAAWIRERRSTDRRPPSSLDDTRFVGMPPAADLATRLLTRHSPPLLNRPAQQTYTTELVGYQIPSRTSVLLMLGAFCAGLLGIGLVLLRRQQLEWLGLWGSLLALATATGLAGVSQLNRGSIPPTVATLQVIEATPNNPDLVVEGTTAIYRPNGGASALSGSHGILMPDMSGLEGTTRRLVWTDLDTWKWENLSLPAGVRLATVSSQVRLPEPLAVTARFGPDGLDGRFHSAGLTEISDVMIAASGRRRMSTVLKSDGSFHAGSGDVQAAESYIAGSLLTDEQRRRQQVLQQFLSRVRMMDISEADTLIWAEPRLLFWTAPLKTDFSFGQELQVRGAALVSVPLRFERTPPGTHVMVPSPFLKFRSIAGPGNEGLSSPYNYQRDEWNERQGMGRSWLRVQLPESVLPMQVDRCRITLQITGPAKKIEVLSLENEKPVPMETIANPIGTVEINITRADALKLDDKGGLIVGLLIGDETEKKKNDAGEGQINFTWRVESCRIEVDGVTQ